MTADDPRPPDDPRFPDDEPRLRGGVFTRLSAGKKSGALNFSAFEEIFAPTRHQARIEVEQQRRVGRPAPAPTDPPELGDGGTGAARFTGRVVLPKKP